ncbi:MAG: hypothetical protein ACP5MT_01340 [Candidatus Acidifodinimicrobium sp.]
MSLKLAGLSLLIVALLSIFAYSVYNHILILNECSGESLFLSNSSEYCIPYSVNAVIEGGSIHSLNFTLLNGKPFLTIWTENLTESGNRYLFSAIPDTFAIHMSYKSNATLDVMIMTNQQYIRWADSNETVLNYVLNDINSTSSFWFNESEGCAAYVMIIKSENNVPFRISPDEQGLYNPTNYPTGACA